MMITFSTVLNITLFSGIAIIILYCIIKRSNILLLYGFRFIHILMIAILLRLFLPIELPTQNIISITTVWPDIYIAFTKPFLHYAGKEWSWWSLFIIISVTGSIFLTAKLLFSYFTFKYTAKNLEVIHDSSIQEIVDSINTNNKKTVHFKLVHYTKINTPIIFGLWKPYILLPDLNLTKDEWYFVLSHEMFHYYHKDLWIRFLCELLQAFYWWNPFVYILRNQITKIQELRVDSAILNKLNCLNKLNYTECLVKIAKQQTNTQQRWTASFSSDNETEVAKRVSLLLKKEEFKRKHTIKSNLLALLLIFTVAFLPNFFLIEPFAMAEEDKNQGIYLNRSNAYFVLNADGLYNVYVNDEYFGTVQEIFDNRLKIYDEWGNIIK